MSVLCEDRDDLMDRWAEAGGSAAHPSIKKKLLYKEARRLGERLPGMKTGDRK